MMNNSDDIGKKIGDAMSSLDGSTRAAVRPFLMTRINARLSKSKETVWERAGQFLTRPAYVIAGLCLLVGINLLVVLLSPPNTPDNNSVAEQMQNAPDDFSSTVATLYDIENTESK